MEDLPRSPADIFIDPLDWQRMCTWWETSMDCMRECELHLLAGKPYRFDYSRLEGGKHGLFISNQAIKPAFRNYIWDLRPFHDSQPGPLWPQAQHPRHERCSWDTAAMLRAASASRYPDLAILEELHRHGLDNRSVDPGHIVLVPNYKGMFTPSNFEFTTKKNDEQSAITPPRLSEFHALPPFVPIMVTAHNVAVQPGTGKLRLTTDFGGPRSLDEDGMPGFIPLRADDPGPLSVNAGQDLSGAHPFPHIDYLTVADLVHNVAILMGISDFCIGQVPPELEIFKFKADYTGYYSQIPRDARCDHVQVHLLSSRGGQVATQILFGDSGACDESNRLESFFVWDIVHRLRASQRSIKSNNWASLPSRAAEPLRAWMRARQTVRDALLAAARGDYHHPIAARLQEYSPYVLSLAAAAACDCFAVGGFFDDTASYSFMFMKEAVTSDFKCQWLDFKIDVADGTDGRPSKVEAAPPATPMTFLGLVPVCEFALSQILLEPKKTTRYKADATALLQEADLHPARKVTSKDVERLEGKFAYCAYAKPALKADVQVMRSLTQTKRRPQSVRHDQASPMMPLSVAAATIIQQVCSKMDSGACATFFPRTGRVGLRNPRLWILSDASGDFEPSSQPLFRGWGAVIFLEGSPTAFVMQDKISFNARVTLKDSTAFELFACTQALRWAAPLIQWFDADVIHVCDNQACVDIINGGKSHGRAERLLYQQRSELLDSMQAAGIIMAVHVLRDRIPEIDYLTKHPLGASADDDNDDFLVPLSTRLTGLVDSWTLVLPPPQGSFLTRVLRAADSVRRDAGRRQRGAARR